MYLTGKLLEAKGPLKAVSTFTDKRINTVTADKGENNLLCGWLFVFPTDSVFACAFVSVYVYEVLNTRFVIMMMYGGFTY